MFVNTDRRFTKRELAKAAKRLTRLKIDCRQSSQDRRVTPETALAANDAGPLDSGADPIAARIVQALEGDIVFGRLKPGQKLREEDLAERFGGSRHQVREGLVRLERLGIVTRARNRGAAVRSFTETEIREIYEVREMLQRQAALRIPLPVDPAIIDSLQSIHDAYTRAVRDGDLPRIHTSNDLFHKELFGLCGNDVLAGLVKHYMDLTYAIRANSFSAPDILAVSQRHHAIMIELLAGRDSWALAQICVDHIQPSKTQYLAAMRRRDPE
jgi:DNA-binding GntR family transcriptional regulator